MFSWLLNKLKLAFSKNNQNSAPDRPKNDLSRELNQNLSQICEIFSQSSDLVIRRFTIEMMNKRQAAIVYIDGLTDNVVINDHILRPLMSETMKLGAKEEISDAEKDLQWIEENLITANELSRNATLEQVIDAILTGDTPITSYVVPFQADVGALLRFGFAIIAGCFGLYGISQGLILVLISLASLRSFGVPYFSPFAPFEASAQKDVIIRAPIWAMFKRPRALEPQDQIRQKPGLRPKPPGNGED